MPRVHLIAQLSLLLPIALGVVGEDAADPIVLRHDVDHARSIEAAAAYGGLAHLNFITPRGFREGEATLIAAEWLLTAAHVTRRLELGQTITVGGEEADVLEVHRHPEWQPSPGSTPDLALVRLATPILHTNPIPLYRSSDEVGHDIILLGLGDYGDGLTGAVDNDGRVRLATNRVDEVTDSWIMFDFDPPESDEATEFEGVAGPGDSGGPALVTVDGIVYLIGVSSSQDRGSASGPGRYGVTEYYTRVSAFADWVDGVIGR